MVFILFSGNCPVFLCRDIDMFDYRVLSQPLMVMSHSVCRHNPSKSCKTLKAELFLAASTWDKVPWIYSPFIWLVFIYISSWFSLACLQDLQPIKPSMQHQGTKLSILPSWLETSIWTSAMQPLPGPGPTNTAHHIPTEPPSEKPFWH